MVLAFVLYDYPTPPTLSNISKLRTLGPGLRQHGPAKSPTPTMSRRNRGLGMCLSPYGVGTFFSADDYCPASPQWSARDTQQLLRLQAVAVCNTATSIVLRTEVLWQ
jgi:hypothetical protein